MSATNVSLQKGEQKVVYCSASAPAGGWITHAFYSLTDPEDAKYLGIAYTSSDCQVTYYGLSAKSKIKVEVTYSYSYRSSYSNTICVGHSSYYEYVTVTGTPDAQSFKIREGSNFTMKPGQQMTLHCDFSPSGSQSDVNWGIVSSLSTYNCIDMNTLDNGASCVITAKKEGTAYIAAMFPGNQKSAQIATIKISDDAPSVAPTSISLKPEVLELVAGQTYTAVPKLLPENSFSKLTWESSNVQVATVTNDGKISAVSAGEATISVRTEGGINSKMKVIVQAVATDFTVLPNVDIALGYSYKVTPTFLPSGSTDNLTWQSSDTSVATVSANGEIRTKRIGTVTITATSKLLNVSREIKVNVTAPAKGMDSGNVRVKVQNFKGIVNRTVVTD